MTFRRLWFSAILVLFATAAGLQTASAATSADVLPSLSPMLQRVSPGVVNISVRGKVAVKQNPLMQDPFFRRFFNMPQQQQPQERETMSVGSGVIIDADKGYIITNHHVIKDAEKITVTLNDRRKLDAKVIGDDDQADIALLQVKADHLTSVPFGNSDSLKVGDFVVAIGNPFGLGQTATLGIVSALGRSGLGIEGYEDFIQTDASINPGNSGGALVDQQGRIVGINTAILSRGGGNIGIGFAIPISMAKHIADQLAKYGKVRRGQLGVLIQDLTPEIAKAMNLDKNQGAVVSRVMPDTAAEKAGLKAGDVILGLNGEAVKGSSDLRNRIGMMRPGDKVSLTVARNGGEMTVDATLGERKKMAENGTSAEPSDHGKLAGVSLSAIPDDHPLNGEVEGAFVRDVDPQSAAAQAGLRPGDIITTVGMKHISSVAALRKAVKEHGSGPLLISIRRGQGALFLAIP
jgi:serine protease Do/serine protease DegQ